MNKRDVKDKKALILAISFMILISFIELFITQYEYSKYNYNYNKFIDKTISVIKEKYPDISDEEIYDVIKGNGSKKNDYFERYGIDLDKDAVLLENKKLFAGFAVLNIFTVLISIIIITIIFGIRNRNRNNEIENILHLVEEINKKNYSLEIDDLSEDELSILKNEIYKTTLTLKETAENSNKDRLELKNSLEDISHQIKTPLTSIIIMLDNIIEDPEMESEVRNDFIIDIKRNVLSINNLIQVLLKLSKFDSNTIKFIVDDEKIRDIVDDAVRNVDSLCDLRNITINVLTDDDVVLRCDKMWQTEAVTNIIKNCVEHSFENSSIEIEYGDNNIYNYINIRDHGEGIKEKDIPHIFERFYKASGSKSDSYGIGLSLAKKIIENDGGNISVESDSSGTKFSIRYFKI